MASRRSLPPSEEARLHHMSNLEPGGAHSAWAAWVRFAAVLLALLGCLNVFQGFLALFDHGYFVAKSDQLVLVNYNAWGALLLLWGGVLLILAAALNAGRGWARWLAVLAAGIDVIAQVGFFPSAPLLALVLIALDVVIIYALTARWDEAQAGY